MRKGLRKIAALGIAALLAVSLVPMATFAAESSSTVSVSTAGEFIEAVNNPDVTRIDLTASINLTGAWVLDVTNKTIDLGGNTISARNFTLIFDGANYTIQNGTFDALGGSYALFIGDEEGTSNALVQNLTLIGGANVYNTESVTFKNVNIKAGDYYAIWNDFSSHITVMSGTYTTSDKSPALIGMDAEDTSLTIQGGTFDSNGKALVLEHATDPSTYNDPVISGGIYDTDPAPYVAPGSTFVSLAKSTSSSTDTPTTVYALGASSIATALATASEGDTVTVLQGTSVSVPDSLQVINETGNAITVNNTEVAAGATIEAHKVSKVEAYDAICTDPGNIPYWECADCGQFFKDETLTDLITEKDTVVPAKGHTFATAWSHDNTNHWHACTACGVKQSEAVHTFSGWVIDKQATASTSGLKHQECSTCNYATEAVTIPATGKTTTQKKSSKESTSKNSQASTKKVSEVKTEIAKKKETKLAEADLAATGDKLVNTGSEVLLVSALVIATLLVHRTRKTLKSRS
jgi:hypothetical protein